MVFKTIKRLMLFTPLAFCIKPRKTVQEDMSRYKEKRQLSTLERVSESDDGGEETKLSHVCKFSRTDLLVNYIRWNLLRKYWEDRVDFLYLSIYINSTPQRSGSTNELVNLESVHPQVTQVRSA